MKNMGAQRVTLVATNRRVPLNTIILPPLSSPLPDKNAELIGKVLVSFIIILLK